MAGIDLLAAYLLDLYRGDPPSWPHPVRLLGQLIASLEAPLRRLAPPRVAGLILTCITVGLAAASAWLLIRLAVGLHPFIGVAVSVFLLYLAISVQDLAAHAAAVARPLAQGDLAAARLALARIVGRDTAALSEPEIIRATVETVAENTVDGVISPLFYGALGGPVLAWVFKAASTLDSMVGYKNDRFRDYGWAGARLDDLLNWLPARLSLAAFTAGACLIGLDAASCWRLGRDHGHRHPSPNAGLPEAAMAGALGIRLGGPSTYGGQLVNKPTLGEACREPHRTDITRAIHLLYATSAVAVLANASLAALLIRPF